MTAERNKAILTAIFDALALGDGRPFVAAMAEDFTWIMEGTTAWSGTFRGKAEVQAKVLTPLFAQFKTPYRNRAERMIAEGDTVVVLCRGEVTTRSGKPYDNNYCYVIRMRDGQMVELREYFDTELVTAALEPPQAAG
ncbi:MAG TPA: nuclear transport factor 2 family protein [Allosphingosinicella sp.]|nr:nuclear transport factor 2 family protein [Allosphingosinicella sp.]